MAAGDHQASGMPTAEAGGYPGRGQPGPNPSWGQGPSLEADPSPGRDPASDPGPAVVVVIDPAAFARRQIRAQLAPLGCVVLELAGSEPAHLVRQQLLRARVLLVEPTPRGNEAAGWLAQLKAVNPAAALVVCTALTTRAAVVAYRRAGAADVVAKPWNPARLEAAVMAALNTGGGTRTPPGATGGPATGSEGNPVRRQAPA